MKTLREKFFFATKTYFKLILRSYKFLIGLILLHCSLLAVLLVFLKKIKNATENPSNQIIQDIQATPGSAFDNKKIFNKSALLIDRNSHEKVLLDFSTEESKNLTKTQNLDHLSTDYKPYWINETKMLDTLSFDGEDLTFTSWQANFAPITDKEKLFKGVVGGFIPSGEIHWYFRYVSNMFASQMNLLKLFSIESDDRMYFTSYLKNKNQIESPIIIYMKFAWKLALVIFLVGCSFVLRVYGDLVENNNTKFFDSIGISKFIQLFTFFSLNLVTTAPATVLISLLLRKIDLIIGNDWHFGFYLMQVFILNLVVFFLDIALISLTGKSSFWHRNFPFFLVMFLVPFKANIDEDFSRARNLLLCLHPWTSFSYLHDKRFGNFDVDLNESVVLCMELVGLLLFCFVSLFIFFMGENLTFNPLSLIKIFRYRKTKKKLGSFLCLKTSCCIVSV